MKENIENKELIKKILISLNKSDSEDFTSEDLETIENISLSPKLVNGIETGITAQDIKFFPSLKSVTLRGYTLTMDDLQIIADNENIENVSFIGCGFKSVDFNELPRIPENLRFSYCVNLPEKFPNVKKVRVAFSEIDMDSIKLENVISLYIKSSRIKNAHNIDEYENIEEVNLDGSSLIQSDGNEIKDIKVGKNAIYSHKEIIERIDGENHKEKNEKDDGLDIER